MKNAIPDAPKSLICSLRRLIRASGPITIAKYMAEALANPNYGYYTTQNPIGKSADFITSPEISQMFGELIGLWCIDIWNKMGSPASLHLVEIGPGKGTLMRDAINASAVMPKFQKRESISDNSAFISILQKMGSNSHILWEFDP